MDTPSGDLGSSPDPLNDSSDATIALLASSAVRRVTRSQRSNSHFALDRGPNSARSTSVSPRKRVFRLDVGNDISPQRIRVTVETEDHMDDSEPESASAKMEDNVSRRLFNGASSLAAKPIPRRGRTSSSAAQSSPVKPPQKAVATMTTKIPLRGLSDDEYAGATPKRPRGRPRRSGTPLPKIAADSRISASPAPSTPAVEMTPRRFQKTGSSASRGDNIATAWTPSSAVSRRAASKRASRAPSVDSDLDSVTDSRPRKRGRPRRLALAPDEMTAIVEQQEEIDSAANFYASIETDDHSPDQGYLEYGAASSPTPTTLSSVDLVKVQTPVPDFEYAPATNYNENYLSPIEEVSGIGADIAPNANGSLENNPRQPTIMDDAQVEGDVAVDADDGVDSGDESGENYGYGANEPDDHAYADEYAAAGDFSTTHDYNDELTTGHESVPPSSTGRETPMKAAPLAVEDHPFDNDGESLETGDTDLQAPITIADAPQSEADLRSDPGLPFGHTPATQRLRARNSRSELATSAVGSEADTASNGAATGSEGGFDMESEMDEAAVTRFRDQDTIAMGEDFSMIGMESLQTSINMSHSELPEMGETTSRIVSRTLESIRQGNDEEGDSAFNMLDIIQQSDPATPTSAITSRDPLPVAGSSHSLRQPPRSSPALSQKGSPKKRAEPLGKVIARKTLQQVQSPAVPQSHMQPARVGNSQHDTVGYDDSFSEIPDSILEAAVPQTTDTVYFSQQQAELTGRMAQFQPSFKGKEPERRTERNYSPQSGASPRDDIASGENDTTSVLGSRAQHIFPIPIIQTTSEHGGDDVYNDGEDEEYGEEAEEEDDVRDEIELEQQVADITSSPPRRLVEPQQQIAESFTHSQRLSQEGTSRATPAAVASPRHPPKAPYIASSERVDRLALPSEAFRPSLSPIMRAGRVLQSVTSDPPSPKDNEGLLRSPFRRSSTRDTRSPSNPPQNSLGGLDPEPSRVSSQTVTQESAKSPDAQLQSTATPSRPPLSASRKLWTTALAPFSGLKNLVVNGAQIVSPRLPPSGSAVPVSQSPKTPGAAKRSAETAQLDGSDRGESSSRIKRLRLSSLPEAPLAARSGSSEADAGTETGRSWRALVFREGSVAGSITSFATKLMSRNAQNPRSNDLEAEADVLPNSGPSQSFPDMKRPVASRFDSRTDEIAFSNDPEVLPATPSAYAQPADDVEDGDIDDGDADDDVDDDNDDADDDDDLDIWAIEASRPTPAPASRVTILSVPPEPVRDPRLVRLGASQINRSVREENLGASISGARRYSTRAMEEAEHEEFSLLDTERNVDRVSQPDNASKRPAPFNLDDFFSSPVAVPKMLPPTSESNIRLNEQSRQETLERLLERDRKRDAEQAEREGSQTRHISDAPKANVNVATANTLQTVQDTEEPSPTSSPAVVEKAAHERLEQSDFNVAFYGEPPASTTPPRVAAGAEEERSWSHSDASEGEVDSGRQVERVPQIKNVPLRRGISRSQQARMNFLRSMRESSVNSEPDSEQVTGGEYAMDRSVIHEEEPSTPLQSFRRSAMLPSSSSEDGPSLRNRRAAAHANSRRVVDEAEAEDEPSYVSSQGEEADEAAAERQAAATNESVFFEEDFAQQAEPETRWGSWATEEGERSYVESESSFMPPVLKPLPAKSASPTKSCLRSPAKGKTPGRVVEFAGSMATAGTGEQVMIGRANLQQATLQFAEHFALDTENRVRAAGRGPLTQSNVQGGNNDGDIDMTDIREATREDDRGRNGRGYEVDEELSEMMLSDAHEISTPLAFMYTPRVQAGRPYFHGANNIPRASWRPPAAIELPPRRDWTLEDWLSMNQMLQEYRRLGPLNFKLRYMPEKRGAVRSAEWTKERPSLALQRKVVHTEKEGMLIKDWHLDIVDVFYIKAGRIWNHHYLLRRLFSLFIGEARHGILLNSELDGLYS
ncbi:hypothetical protein CMQ_4609 [Grosmannia clavigera kw1407]|uniref:Uncharacterized protein n=1 Tax=Grosmannia clavigera (strain kw1407 / UAMH 11150) TaxID=655863 RepID=F0XTZ2_GROCL|nr:uncharacterized protein CMQ_4609 [Grosmannia clavigera kw1407]EFW98757.1 hypothetical protein CMQ_4609 [Grosmannia clavigera kw1407]